MLAYIQHGCEYAMRPDALPELTVAEHRTIFLSLHIQMEWSEYCDCSHSDVTVFLATMLGIRRMLQCLRCCWDTRKLSPGLPNGAKYMTTILMHASLGMYRIHQTDRDRHIFIVTATSNGLYTSF
jgi:hypothetical protein